MVRMFALAMAGKTGAFAAGLARGRFKVSASIGKKKTEPFALARSRARRIVWTAASRASGMRRLWHGCGGVGKCGGQSGATDREGAEPDDEGRHILAGGRA